MRPLAVALISLLLNGTAAQPMSVAQQSTAGSAAPPPQSHHEANFNAERAQADALYKDGKQLESLPLYEDLCRQDPTIAVFAERHAGGLFAKEATVQEPNERLRIHMTAMNEIRRAQKLGDNSDYVRVVLDAETKTLAGAVVSGIPMTVGYTYRGSAEAQAREQEGNAAFARSDFGNATTLFEQASVLDPKWYEPALFAGDSYFRMKDYANAGTWFAKAIAIDPDRETAYRYWGDTLFRAGERDRAREKFVQAVVAEPYARGPLAELGQWARVTGHQLVVVSIKRPEFITPNGELKIDPELAASKADGRSSWIVYQQYRVAHGARVLNQFIVGGGSDASARVTSVLGYEHTIAEEHAALRAMLADVQLHLNDGTLKEADLDESIRNLRLLERSNVLGAWIAISAADAGIRQDYPAYRSNHRKHLLEYVNGWMIR